jgi:hypothetical protein
MDLREYRQRQARSFTANLRNGTNPLYWNWQDPNQPMPDIGGEPRGISGFPYQGDNALQLQMAAKAQGFRNPYWLTFDQAKAAGGSVRPGEVGTKILDWKGGKDGVPYEQVHKTMFNGDQIRGLNLPLNAGLSPEQQAIRQGGLDALIAPRKKTPTPQQYNARLAEMLAEQFPDAQGEQEQADVVLRRELAMLTAQARLGLPREADPSLVHTMKPFIERRPHWKNIDLAIDDASKALDTIGIKPLAFDRVPRKEVQPDVAPAADPRGKGKSKVKSQEKVQAQAKDQDIPF